MLEGTAWERHGDVRRQAYSVFSFQSIHSMLQEQYDSEDSHVPTGEHPKVQTGTTLILAPMTSHWVFLVSVSLGPFRC